VGVSTKGWTATFDCGKGPFEEPVGGGFNAKGLLTHNDSTIAGSDDTGNTTFNFTRK